MPIPGYGLTSRQLKKSSSRKSAKSPKLPEIDNLPLPSLLSKPLLAFVQEAETESPISLAICANVIRILTLGGMRVRDLPTLSGASKESLAMAFGILRKARLAVIEKEPRQGPWQLACLTERGIAVQKSYPVLMAEIEKGWESRFGKQAIKIYGKRRRPSLAILPTQTRFFSSPSSHIPMAGVPPSLPNALCLTFPWCCTVADTPTAASARSHSLNRKQIPAHLVFV